MAVKIGEVIHGLVKDSGLKAKVIAEYINVSESTLFGIYKRESVDIDKLILFSKLLNKNLFLYYLNEEPLKSMLKGDLLTYQNRIADLEIDLQTKSEKIKDMADLIETQKKIIALYEGTNNKKRK